MSIPQTKEVQLIEHVPQQERRMLERDLELMKDYLLMCFRKEDWHGVMDASADIREIVSKLSVFKSMDARRLQ